MKNFSVKFSRFAIFIVYFWFGILKVFGTSPANPLVDSLLQRTLPGITFAEFIIVFGVFEVVIGLLFLWPRFTKPALVLLVIHIFTTIMPLFVLTASTWQGFLTPTLEGQYIIKNILIVALAFDIIYREHLFRK